MLAFIIFATLTIIIFLSAIAVFKNEIKHDNTKKDTHHDILHDK